MLTLAINYFSRALTCSLAHNSTGLFMLYVDYTCHLQDATTVDLAIKHFY